MDNKPLVSYIVPVYNVEKYLERCLDSLLGQTYPNVELILVDDGSTDGSGEICDRYSAEHKNIYTFHLQNGGASLARKYGLEKVKGEYVGFVDSDDTVDVRITEWLMNALGHTSLDIAACDMYKALDGEDAFENRVLGGNEIAVLENKELMRRFFHYDFWGFGGKLYRRSVFQDLYFPKATISEDYVLMVQLFVKYQRIAYVPQPLYHYRLHPGGLSTLALNERKFEELENTAYVYHYVRHVAKNYEGYALSNYVGTCVKLLCAVYREKKTEMYAEYVFEMKKTLRENFKAILKNGQMSWKFKLLVCILLFCPYLICKIAR